ncbi:hypothetical protein GA0061099_103310 [Bradyrhizobium yuanmingense]|uniref:Uncharacterized protein n=1 Tax=Bradyrhizobium yuanmingense TaxID=108015 RepID=A0A1C3XKF5_9BRAD|nr:hypothetical protein IQ15_07436 [Bradyrhizobium yuanmingense]SCB52464.1 hypothetical protein GA0061099_103310 [Bradyrhizobium yuanmingense]
MTDAGCFGLLLPALLVRITTNRRGLALGGKDRSTEVARKRRTKLRDWLPRSASIVLWQSCNAVRNIVMISAIKLINRLVSWSIVLQRPQDRAADSKQGNRTPSSQDFSRQPCHARMLCSQAETFGVVLLRLR